MGREKTKIRSSILQQNKNHGSLAFPVVQHYYQSAMIEYIVQWWKQPNESWDIEQMSLEMPLKEWCLLAEARETSSTENRVLKILLQVWKQCVKQFIPTLSPLASII